MYIYKITNKINGKWYIGKTNGKDPNYMGSGKLLKRAYKKHGLENFEKVILESCLDEHELNEREKFWISTTNATTDPLSYNLSTGGEGGDLSKFIPYDKIDYSNHKCEGSTAWFHSLTKEEQKEFHARQAAKRTKGWYVSKVDDPTETYVQNISKWCEDVGIDKSMPTRLNNTKSPLFQKQTKGWRIRRADMPALSPYENLRGKVIVDNRCKGRGWKLVDGIRVWYDK
jgi:hypothetical protein